jgi:hypothetical protein
VIMLRKMVSRGHESIWTFPVYTKAYAGWVERRIDWPWSKCFGGKFLSCSHGIRYSSQWFMYTLAQNWSGLWGLLDMSPSIVDQFEEFELEE